MKQIIKLLILPVVLLLFFLNVNGQSVSTITFSEGNGNLPTVSVPFDVPISVEDIGDVFSLTIFIDYDPAVIEYDGPATITYGPGKVTVSNQTASRLKLLLDHNTPFTAITVNDGLLADLSFVHNGGYSPITFRTTSPNASSFLSSLFVPVPITTVTNGSVGLVSNIISSGIWSLPANWSKGVVPTSFHDVTVNGGVVSIDANAVANEVTVADGGQLTLDAAVTLDVTGAFTIESGGSFIQNGTLNAASTVAERAIVAANWGNGLDGWHMISSPVANQSISGDWTPTGGGNDYDFYAWGEPQGEWLNQKVGANSITTFEAGQGYLVAYQQTATKSFSGAFNTADVDTDLTNTAAPREANIGANLLGNPYPSALVWNNAAWTVPGDLQAAAYIWERSTSAYKTITAGEVIPAMNGFMVVLENAATASMTIPADARVHNSQAWYKSAGERIVLAVHDANSSAAQSSVVGFDMAATEGYDRQFDAYFLPGYAPLFYSYAEGTKLMLNTLPQLDHEMMIPFGFEKTASNNYYITLESSITGEMVYLTDLKANTTVMLSEIGEYHFTAEEGDDPDRFRVHFSAVGLNEVSSAQPSVYMLNDKMVIHDLNQKTQVRIYNLQGQNLYATQSSGNGRFEISLPELPAGVYVVNMRNAETTTSVKVFIQ